MTQFVQWRDRNVNGSIYEHSRVRVTDIFPTFQGEGPFMGYPAVFLRLAGCNRGEKLDCPYCDSYFNFDQGNIWDPKDLAIRLHKEQQKAKTNLLVITGGEPLIQLNQIFLLLDELILLGSLRVQIETNGDLIKKLQTKLAHYAEVMTIVCSPKIAHTTQNYKHFYPKELELIDYLKIVVEENPESPYNRLPAFLDKFIEMKGSTEYVFISPINIYKKEVPPGGGSLIWDADIYDHAQCQKNYQYATQVALANGFRLSFQTHLFAGVK